MIKTILVPATGSDRDTAVFASALAVARPFAAHIEFLHVRPDAAATAVAMAADGGGATMVGGLINRLEEEADAAREKGKPAVPRLLRARRGWRSGMPHPVRPVRRRSGFAKSAPNPIGSRNMDAPPTSWSSGARIPTRVSRWTPSRGRSSRAAARFLYRLRRPWRPCPKPSPSAGRPRREAARALTAALPFLQIAKQIVILTVAEDQRAPEDEADRLMTALRWHGVPISVRHLRPDARGAPETLLSAAAEHAALLVMGGYGHSRLREWIFGGFTWHVLRAAEVPVLMAH